MNPAIKAALLTGMACKDTVVSLRYMELVADLSNSSEVLQKYFLAEGMGVAYTTTNIQ